VLVEVPEPTLTAATTGPAEPGEIIFQPEHTCLCGSDLPFFDSDFEGEEATYPREIATHSMKWWGP